MQLLVWLAPCRRSPLPPPLTVFTWGLCLQVSLCSFLVRTPASGLGVHPKSRMISLKNPSLRLQRPFCPNKVHLTGSRGQDVDNTWGHPQPPLPSKLTGPHPPPAWGVSRHRRQMRSCAHWPQTPGRPCHVPGTVRASARPTAQVRTPRGLGGVVHVRWVV